MRKMDVPMSLVVFISLLAFVNCDSDVTTTVDDATPNATTAVTENVTTENTTTSSNTTDPATTTAEANATTSAIVTTETTETSKSSSGSSTTGYTTGSPGPEPKSGGFNALSFIGGIVLCLGVFAIGYVGFKFYKSRTERNYHTL